MSAHIPSWVGGFLAGAITTAAAWAARSWWKREMKAVDLEMAAEEMAEAEEELLDELVGDNANPAYREAVRAALGVFPEVGSGPREAFEATVRKQDYEALQCFISWVGQGPEGERHAEKLKLVAAFW